MIVQQLTLLKMVEMVSAYIFISRISRYNLTTHKKVKLIYLFQEYVGIIWQPIKKVKLIYVFQDYLSIIWQLIKIEYVYIYIFKIIRLQFNNLLYFKSANFVGVQELKFHKPHKVLSATQHVRLQLL